MLIHNLIAQSILVLGDAYRALDGIHAINASLVLFSILVYYLRMVVVVKNV